MSEKITFGELIESIAAETDHSKQFTHDFLKDFVDVINGGLEEDGKVNIAGFGKFQLKRVDERQGYNPQTEEKMTIPAHNKIVFKPYKDLRELVNAPYAHIEPKLLEETSDNPDKSTVSSSTKDKDTDETTEVENSSPPTDTNNDQSDHDETSVEDKLHESDFIPTGPPTSHEEEVLEDSSDNTEENKSDDPFNFASDKSAESPEAQNESEDDNGDIVEFNADSPDEEDTKEEILERFIGATEEEATPEDADPKADLTAESEEQAPSAESSEEILAEEVEKLEETAEELKQESDQAQGNQEPTEEGRKEDEKALPSVGMHQPNNRTAAVPYVAATIVLLLLIVGGTWYYSSISDSSMPLISSEQTTASADVTNSQTADNQQDVGNAEVDEAQRSDAESQSSSNNNTTSNNTASTKQAAQSASTDAQNETSVEIEEGQTLWSMAEERYGNPRLWPWIYGYDGSVEDPDVIYAGSSLSVPLPSGPQNSLNATDSVGVAKGFLATYKWYKSNEEAEAKNHLWAAKSYHNNLQQIADIPIDKADLSFANSAR